MNLPVSGDFYFKKLGRIGIRSINAVFSKFGDSRAARFAKDDIAHRPGRLFAAGNRPVIRWIKGDGRDDEVTRAAIAMATRLFGNRVDYCLCTAEISAARARSVLAWAEQPVEWWPVTLKDNPALSAALLGAGCYPDWFGYWWKWFPERVRMGAPEWILDGDMILTSPPQWFKAWIGGTDQLRVSQNHRVPNPFVNDGYGEYLPLINQQKLLYSGIISLPPGLSYMDRVLDVLRRQPLAANHDGRNNKSEQGVIACAFDSLDAIPIPLSEFPYAVSVSSAAEPASHVWGYHFARSFIRENQAFRRMEADGRVFRREGELDIDERFIWLRNHGQWGIPGWSMHPTCVKRIAVLAKSYRGQRVLEIGTSRGRLAAIMAAAGCVVTTIDKTDRGARANLEGLGVDVVVSDGTDFLRRSDVKFSLIVVDLHDNSKNVWRALWPLISHSLNTHGALVLYNSHLWKMPEWHEETGLQWITERSPQGWSTELFPDPLPGMVICRHA